VHTEVTTALTHRELAQLIGIQADSVSHRGSRSLNADAVGAYTDIARGRSAFVVADGIGDHLLAVRAARTAAATAAHASAASGAVAGILAAQHELTRQFPQAKADCVLVVAVLPAPEYPDMPCDIAWVGDCRAYRWNGRVLHQITTDHTVAEVLSSRGIRPTARMGHLVTTSVRTVAPEEIGHATTGTSSGRFLLASDGAHKPLTIADIRDLLATAETPGAAAAALTDRALRAGGTDNTTALVLDRA
jgi:protein phosphatase